MTIFDMLEQSGVLTLFGMGVVFSFLVVMIVAITLVGKVIHGLGLDKDTASSAAAKAVPAAAKSGNGEVTAAISAAVNEYRKNN
ncbi:MAG: OadG family protein [Treponema sp.]|jgi:oxaloacetate decarboxylase gamma subunit|nr:OadG family protein [Treponema sp.]